MNTAKYSSNGNSYNKVTPLTLFSITFVVLFGITGCFDSSTEDTNSDLELSKAGVALPTNHTESVGGVLHAPGRFTPFSSWCTSCHGQALEGNRDLGAPACTACHATMWTETTPPSGGTRNPPSNHTDDANGFLHAAGKDMPFTNWCTACHGPALEGDLGSGGPSCTTCHAVVWTETTPPVGGGRTTNAPSNHTDNVNGFLHAAGKDTPYTHWCTACHGTDLTGDIGPSCTSCHSQVWTETAPTGGGSTSNPPSNHTDDVNGFLHAVGKDTPYTNWCTVCHGPGLEGDLDTGAPSCTTCHGQIWTETTPPGGGGSTSNPPSNHTDNVLGFLHAAGKDTPYSNWCTACHGPALEGNLDSGAPSCTTCHGQLWTETAPPSGGGSNPPSNHTDDVSGFSHAIGKDTPYTSWCTACHGSALEGNLDLGAPSCTTCHGQVWSETTPPSGGGTVPPSNHTNDISGFLHASGNDTPYSSWCTACHGADLTGNRDLGAPSCTACHSEIWTETTPPSGGGSSTPPVNHTDNVNSFLHAAGKDTPYSSWCTACHGAALEGDLSKGIPSCTACHAQVWTETAPPSGGGTSNPPSNHTDDVNGFLHGTGKDAPYSSWCTACHGSALEGNLDLGAPSCTACHGQVWSESTPPGGGGSGSTPPSNHTENISGFLHAAGKVTPYSNWCTACHGDALEGNLDLGAPSCTACHGQVWTETAPPSGGSSTPPSNHTNNISGFYHAPGNQTPYSSWCTACHGSALQGNLDIGAPSCTACHGQVWSETNPPGGGGSGTLPSSHTNNISGFLHAPGNETPYSSWCTVCHGSSLQGDLNLGAPPCTACHTVLWSDTGGGPTGNPPANHTDNVSGFSHAPGKERPYSNWCWGCHGSNLQGNPSMGAPPCTVCHSVQWSETSSAARRLPINHNDSQEGYLHAPGKNAPYTNLCTVCHGADLRGDLAPSCYQCHGQKWSESGGGSGGGGGGGGGD